ncbi:MAG: hypothetical protein K5663_11390 [Clostridiales bacterium]|nr:hypothetical protein [Clostridiales bacterium]
MRTYPEYWNETVTLYTRSVGSDGLATWTSTVYQGCFWQHRSALSTGDGRHLGVEKLICRFRVPAPAVKPGDIVIRGEINSGIDEYTEGQRSADLLKSHTGNGFTVTATHDNTGRTAMIPHLYAEGAAYET